MPHGIPRDVISASKSGAAAADRRSGGRGSALQLAGVTWACGQRAVTAAALVHSSAVGASLRALCAEWYIRPSGTSTCPVPSTSSRRIKTGFANTIIHSQSRPAAPPSQPPTPHSACATPNAPGALSQSYSVRHGSVSCC
jgi:hypothetical protein